MMNEDELPARRTFGGPVKARGLTGLLMDRLRNYYYTYEHAKLVFLGPL